MAHPQVQLGVPYNIDSGVLLSFLEAESGKTLDGNYYTLACTCSFDVQNCNLLNLFTDCLLLS